MARWFSEKCDDSKGFQEDGTVDEDDTGDPDYCAWILMAFPKGDWSRFKAWLVDFEAYAKRLSFDLDYYRQVIKEMEEYKP